MFRRLVLDYSVSITTLVAFITAASIYGSFAWRALRMKRPQLARFEELPFATPTPAAGSPDAGHGANRPFSS